MLRSNSAIIGIYFCSGGDGDKGYSKDKAYVTNAFSTGESKAEISYHNQQHSSRNVTLSWRALWFQHNCCNENFKYIA